MEHDVARFAEAWRKAWSEQAREAEARAERARMLLPDLVQVLVEGWRPQRIWLIGSLLHGRFGAQSDLDLVVEGLPQSQLFNVCAALDRTSGDISVDLVPLESARPFVRDLIARGEAELLFDASSQA